LQDAHDPEVVVFLLLGLATGHGGRNRGTPQVMGIRLYSGYRSAWLIQRHYESVVSNKGKRDLFEVEQL
jgi:hypothetical protein